MKGGWKKFIDALWEKHASPDKHGYKDLMRSDAFDAACKELIEEVGRRVIIEIQKTP